LVQPSFDHQAIAKFGSFAIINLRSHDHRILLGVNHLREAETEFFGEQRARDFDEAQIRDVVHDPAAIGIEKHYSHFGTNARRISGEHAVQSFRMPR
jgi:hypothetical protein